MAEVAREGKPERMRGRGITEKVELTRFADALDWV